MGREMFSLKFVPEEENTSSNPVNKFSKITNDHFVGKNKNS